MNTGNKFLTNFHFIFFLRVRIRNTESFIGWDVGNSFLYSSIHVAMGADTPTQRNVLQSAPACQAPETSAERVSLYRICSTRCAHVGLRLCRPTQQLRHTRACRGYLAEHSAEPRARSPPVPPMTGREMNWECGTSASFLRRQESTHAALPHPSQTPSGARTPVKWERQDVAARY